MQTEKWSIQDAKNKLGAVVAAAKTGKAQIVTRRGVPAAVILSIEAFEKLQQLEAAQAPSFIDHLLSMPRDDGEFERMSVQPRDFE
ncbi:MAG: type II toxin-antitoxin system Phd/YefM family antitoxin [Methylococcaceae bacterium]